MSHEESRYRQTSVAIVAGMGLIIGMCGSILAILLLRQMETPNPFEELAFLGWAGLRSRGAPAGFWGIVSLGLGWLMSWTTERRGFVSNFPVAGCAMIAAGVSCVVTRLTCGSLPIEIIVAFVVGAICMMVGGWIRGLLNN